jgi:Domain of unknown function (DUF222)/HNH endonuclease
VDGQQTHPVVDRLRGAVDSLLSTELSMLGSGEVTGLLADLEVQRRRLEAVDQQVIAETDRRGLAGDYGSGTAANLLSRLLRISPVEAQARVARARDLGPRTGLTGEPLEPILPATADAVRAGQLSSAHVTVITQCLDAIPAPIGYQAGPAAEAFLIEAARHEHPTQLRKTAALLLSRLDPDGAAPRDEAAEAARGFGLRKHQDGTATPTGRFTPELTALWETVLDSLAGPQPGPDGEPDPRTGAQRRHDAVAEALSRVLRSGELPETGGVPVTILIRANPTDLHTGTGVAVTSHGTPISISKLLHMSGDAAILSILCDTTGGILSYGRQRRLASKGQRLALAARDGGCSFPGCDRPAAWTEVHHIITWIHGGPTDIDNMCLLCRYHHRHFETLGWQVFMHHGLPWWRPPTWIDPERRPIRNTAHHLDDIQFQAPAYAG